MDTCSLLPFVSNVFIMVPKSTHWVCMNRASELLEKNKINVVVIQGNLRYCDNLLQSCLGELVHKDLTSIVIAPEGRTRRFAAVNRLIKSWRRISHSEVGVFLLQDGS